jgi:hypothetical protein
MIQADSVHSTPLLNSSPIQEANPPPNTRAESADLFNPRAGIEHHKTDPAITSSPKAGTRQPLPRVRAGHFKRETSGDLLYAHGSQNRAKTPSPIRKPLPTT